MHIFFYIVIGLIWLSGGIIFFNWLNRTSFGRRAFSSGSDLALRSHSIPFYWPLVWLFLWFIFLSFSSKLSAIFSIGRTDTATVTIGLLFQSIFSLLFAGLFLIVIRNKFTNGLKGFGLNIKTIFFDLRGAVINLVCIWPIVILILCATGLFCRLFFGPDFQLPTHHNLSLLAQHHNFWIYVLTFFLASFVAPIVEELLFRGLFQTIVVSMTGRRWLAIIISSCMFTTCHFDYLHWPALFALGLCLGYAYEKSGSLFRSIFIHSLFNSISVISIIISQITTNS